MSKTPHKPPTVGSAFFDFDAMRNDILKRQHEAMRPFQLELRELEIVESMLQRQADPGIERAHERFLAKARAAKPLVKPNGLDLPYAEMTQRKAIVEVIRQEPGLEAFEVTERLKAGGYPFLSPAPLASVHTALREIIKDGLLKRKPEVSGHSKAKVHHYYPIVERTHTVRRNSDQAVGISAAVLGVLKKAPVEGFDRSEIVTLLDNRFSRKQVTWALNGFVKDGNVKRHLHDKLPSATRFTLV